MSGDGTLAVYDVRKGGEKARTAEASRAAVDVGGASRLGFKRFWGLWGLVFGVSLGLISLYSCFLGGG